MALARVEKINLIAHKNKQEEILEVLQNLGFIEIEEQVEKGEEKKILNEKISQLDYKIAGLKFSLNFLANYETEKKTLAQKIDPKIELTPIELERIVNTYDYQAMIKTVQEIEVGINESQSTLDKFKDELAMISPWANIDFIPNRQKFNSNFDYKFISINQPVYPDFLNKLQKQLPLTAVEKITEEKKEIRAVVLFKKEQENLINESLNEFGIKISEMIDLEVTIPERLKEINQGINQAQNRIVKLENEAKRLAVNQKNLMIAFDYLTWQRDKVIGQQKGNNTWQTFSIIGWIDQDLIKPLEKTLNKITDIFTVEKLLIAEDESVPVIFKNSWAKPFEAVTNVYGAPLHYEPDPTPFLAPFFILFFGLCLTDAGYGVILALLCWLGLKILKPSKEMAKMFKVLMYGGIVTFFAGALVGGWFGIVIDEIKIDWLRNLLVNIRMIDPVKDPIKMLIFCLILGIIQVVIGIIVGMWWKIKNKNYVSAVLDNGLWLYFIAVILLWSGTKIGLVSFAPALYLLWSGMIALILTQGRDQKNPILKLGGGIISLYGIVGYLSDVLSYSRLLALGLATGIIAMVINLIAGLTIEMVPYLGWVIAIFILIGGHIFNIGINALGAFIHSSRLQFVEFFPKFMEGGGRSFQPFKKETKYIRIKNA